MKARNFVYALLVVLLLASACATPTPQVVEKVVTQVVEKEKVVEKVQTQVVEKIVEKAQTVVVEKEVAVTATPAPDAGAKLKGKKMAAVFSGPVNDAGWTTSAYKSLVDMRDKYGMQIAYSENIKPADAEQVFRDYAKAGFDIILGHGFEWAEPIAKVAKEFPKTNFIQTNGTAADIPNLYTITLSAGEGGYFVGMIACQISKSGKVAYVAGQQFPLLDHHIKMSRQACTDLNKKVDIIESYVGGWADPAKAKELAAADIENGVDVLILEADAGDLGTIEAAKEAVAKGKPVKVVSWVKDKNYLAPDIVIGGWDERIEREIEFTLQKIANGDNGGHFAIGVAEGAAGLNPFYGLVPPEIEKSVVDAYQGYIKDPKSLPNLVVRTDL